MLYFKKFLLFCIILLSLSCSKNLEKKILIEIPSKIEKINEKVLIYIPEKEIKLKKNFQSEKCDSKNVNLLIEEPFKRALLKLLSQIFDNFTVTNQKQSNKNLSDNYFAYIEIIPSDIFSVFYTEGNMAKFFSKFSVDLSVMNNSRTIENKIIEENSWKRNLYFRCRLPKGSYASIQSGINRIISTINRDLSNSLLKL